MQCIRNYAIASVIALLVLPLTTLSQTEPGTSRPEQSETSSTPPGKFIKHENPIPNRYIVVLNDNVVSSDAPLEIRRARVTAIANSHAEAHDGKVGYIYETALKGYSIELPNEAAAIAISNLPEVRWVEEDVLGKVDSGVVTPRAESRKLIEVDVNTTRCDDIKSLLDFAHGELDKNQTAKLHIVYYGGKRYNNQIWNEKLKGYDQKYLLPKRGEAKARVSFWKPYLVDTRRIDGSRIEVIDGGYREKPGVEMWIVPLGANPPVPTPALNERDIRFRKGKPKWRDMYAESC